MKKLIEDIL